MRPNDDSDADNLELILEISAHIQRRTGAISEADFVADRDEIHLTAYRLSVIGETTRNLSQALKQRHPEMNWAAIYGLRNVVAHNYASLDPARIWLVAINSLDTLRLLCSIELGRLRQYPTSASPDRR